MLIGIVKYYVKIEEFDVLHLDFICEKLFNSVSIGRVRI